MPRREQQPPESWMAAFTPSVNPPASKRFIPYEADPNQAAVVFSLADTRHPDDVIPACWPYRGAWHVSNAPGGVYKDRQITVRDDGAWGVVGVDSVPVLLCAGKGPTLRGRIPPAGTADRELYDAITEHYDTDSFALPVPRARSFAALMAAVDTMFPSAACPVQPGTVWQEDARGPNMTQLVLVTAVVREDVPLWPRASADGRLREISLFGRDALSLPAFTRRALQRSGAAVPYPRGTGGTFATWELDA